MHSIVGRRLNGWLTGALLVLAMARGANADIALRRVNQQLPRVYGQWVTQWGAQRVLARTSSLALGDLGVELPGGYSAVRVDRVSAGAETYWAAPKHLLLDHVAASIGRSEFLTALGTDAGGTGKGVVVGIADSGVDLTHPDLRDAAGNSRVAWLIDFSVQPLGFYPELEDAFGCSGELPCAVLGQAEIDQLIAAGTLTAPAGQTARLPRDVLGHGTHVASIAAGGGLSDSRYTGIAPEATLIVAQIASLDANVDDAAVALAAQFVFERAENLQLPAVLNLSLGGDFGPHDGKSVLGEVLKGFLDRPGRAMVVAAGNSGGLVTDGDVEADAPLGVHTAVQVASGRSVAVPLIIPSDAGNADGSAYVWVGLQPGDSLAVGVEDADGNQILAPVAAGKAESVDVGSLSVTVINQSKDYEDAVDDIERGAAVILDGTLRPGPVYLRLSGTASVGLWVQSGGGISPAVGSRGALFANAQQEGTINTPADTPELIAVGATLNRLDWPGRAGATIELEQFDPSLQMSLGTATFFSSLGPTASGRMKPDILAPGGVVVAALSKSADPALHTGLSLFSQSPLCSVSPDCAVVDDQHVASVGTSMASPIVAGAVALLLEQDPGLTQEQIRHLIQASASRLADGTSKLSQGIGSLNLPRALEALRRRAGDSSDPSEPDADHSWVTLSDEVAHLGSAARMQALVHLQTADGAIADPPVSALRVDVKNGELLGAIARLAPGLYGFDVRAKTDKNGKLQVNVSYRDQGLVAIKATVAPAPEPVARVAPDPGCAVRPAATVTARHASALVLLLLAWALRRGTKRPA